MSLIQPNRLSPAFFGLPSWCRVKAHGRKVALNGPDGLAGVMHFNGRATHDDSRSKERSVCAATLGDTLGNCPRQNQRASQPGTRYSRFKKKLTMKFSFAAKTIAASALCMLTLPVFSHISLEIKTAPSGSTYKAVLQVGHGCQGAATTGVSVQIPAGFQGVKPYPKAGWTLTTQSAKLAQP